MTREFFNKQFAALVCAYISAQKLPDETQDTYWAMLQDIPDEKFSVGVKKCLTQCKFFPTIAELGEASMPDVIDYKAPLPPLDHPRATLNWFGQLKRQKEKDKIDYLRNGGIPKLLNEK